jgi:hypothetical protein
MSGICLSAALMSRHGGRARLELENVDRSSPGFVGLRYRAAETAALSR